MAWIISPTFYLVEAIVLAGFLVLYIGMFIYKERWEAGRRKGKW